MEQVTKAENQSQSQNQGQSANGLLSKEAILKARELATEDVDIKELGGKVRVREMTGAQRDAWEGSNIKGRGKNMTANLVNARARLVAYSVIDNSGQLLFNPDDPAEINRIGQLSCRALDAIYDVAARLSGIRDEDLEELSGN